MTHPKKIWHLTEEHGWQVRTMEAIDANHAVSVDPEHWSFEKPSDEPVEAVEDVDLSGAGDAA